MVIGRVDRGGESEGIQIAENGLCVGGGHAGVDGADELVGCCCDGGAVAGGVGLDGDVEGVGVVLDVADDCLEGGKVTDLEGGGGGGEGEAQGEEGGGELHVDG